MIKGKHYRFPSEVQTLVFGVLAFLIMLGFFTLFHPIPIMDGDDITYTVLIRKAMPVPGSWNPARVLPEVLITLCSMISALLTRLGAGTFIHCQVFVYAAVYSLFIALYFSAFRNLLMAKGASDFTANCTAIFFAMLHFLVFRTEYERNLYMFHTYDACCVFYYTVPALTAGGLVMWLLAGNDLQDILTHGSILKKSLWLTVLYFAVYSNLFGSILLASYSGWMLVNGLIKGVKRHASAAAFLKSHSSHLLIVLFWLSAVLLEMTGGRAESIGSPAEKTGFAVKMGETLRIFILMLANSNLLFRLLFAMLTILGLILFFRNRRAGKQSDVEHVIAALMLCGLVTFVFIIFLSAAVQPSYVSRPEAVFPVMFVMFAVLALVLTELAESVTWTGMLLPVALLVMFGFTNTRFLTFADSNPLNMNGNAAKKMQNEIYESIITAANNGESEIYVPAPMSNQPGNWPHINNVGNLMAEYFLKYGIIDRKIDAWIVPSEEINTRYGITFPEQ